ncbi:hypothetical protein Tco_0102909 [Tanacetum coccineum]
MVSVTIYQDTFAIPPMTSLVIDLVSRPDSPNVHQPLPTTTTATATTTTTTTIMTTIPLPPQPQQGSSSSILINHLGELEQHIVDLVDANQALEERLDKHGSRLYRLENQDIPNQVSKAVDEIVTDAVDKAMQAPLRERFRDLPEADMKEILHNRMWESKSYQTHEDHMMLYEALEKSMARDNSNQLLSNLAKARKKKKKGQGLPKTPPGSLPHPPPPPPPPAGPSGTSGASGASGSSQSPHFIIMANLPPPNHVADLPEDDPEEQPKHAPKLDHLNEFAPYQIPQPEGNMNGWILEDDEEEEEDPKMEEEMEEENDDDDDDDEVINPYKEADPLNLPLPDSDTVSEDTAVAPTPDDHEQEAEADTIGTITRVPYSVRPFSGTVYVGSGPSRYCFAP